MKSELWIIAGLAKVKFAQISFLKNLNDFILEI